MNRKGGRSRTPGNTIPRVDLTDTSRALHPAILEYTSISSTHGTFSMMDQLRHHKTRVNIFKRIVIIQSMFFDHSGLKLEINNRKKKTLGNSQIYGNEHTTE